MGNVFFDLTIILCVATLFSFVFRLFKQPPILAYILTGIILGPLGYVKLAQGDVMQSLSEIGIALLLFMLGLELRISELKSVGKIALTTGLGQILFTALAGYGISLFLGFSHITSIYLAIAMTFSSTIIIVKLLADKKDINSLYGKIAVGLLLAQDFVAIIALIVLSGMETPGAEQGIHAADFLLMGLKIVVIGGWIVVLSQTVFPRLINHLAKSSEVLFLFSIAWAFGMAAFVSSPFIGFSIEIGGFLAGLALANSVGHLQIAAKVRSLRDFFITIFFVTLGMQMTFGHIGEIIVPSLLLSLFVIIGNPLVVMVILGVMGHRKRTSFLAGLTMAQISEFSLILIFMGNKLGQVPDRVVAMVTIVAAITFVVSTYFILHSNQLYKRFSPYLDIFERKKTKRVSVERGKKDHVILVGANRMGESILDALIEHKYDVSVVDFDPDVIDRLKDRDLQVVYGDVSDPEIQEEVNLSKAKMVISTVPDVDDNLILLNELNKENPNAVSILFALEAQDAKLLYDRGAEYVVLPHLAGGRHLAKVIVEEGCKHLKTFRERDLRYIV